MWLGNPVAKGPYKGSKHDLVLITLKTEAIKEKKSTGSIELEFPDKTTIKDMSDPKEEPVSVDNLKIKMTDFGDAKADEKPSHVQIKTDGGINIKALLSKTEKQPLFILNGKRLAANSPQLQSLDSKSIVTIDLIESGPGLLEYGDAAQYGALIIRTKQNVEATPLPETKISAPNAATLAFQKDIESSLTTTPNPFNRTIQVNFNLPQAARARVSVYDLNGKEVKSFGRC